MCPKADSPRWEFPPCTWISVKHTIPLCLPEESISFGTYFSSGRFMKICRKSLGRYFMKVYEWEKMLMCLDKLDIFAITYGSQHLEDSPLSHSVVWEVSSSPYTTTEKIWIVQVKDGALRSQTEKKILLHIHTVHTVSACLTLHNICKTQANIVKWPRCGQFLLLPHTKSKYTLQLWHRFKRSQGCHMHLHPWHTWWWQQIIHCKCTCYFLD